MTASYLRDLNCNTGRATACGYPRKGGFRLQGEHDIVAQSLARCFLIAEDIALGLNPLMIIPSISMTGTPL